jgi:hypothetical protein
MNVIIAASAQGRRYGYLTKTGYFSNVVGHLTAGDSTDRDVKRENKGNRVLDVHIPPMMAPATPPRPQQNLLNCNEADG